MKKKATILSIFAVLVAVILATPLHSVEIKTSSATAAPRYGDGLLVSVRVSGGDGTVFDPGDRVKLTFQTSEDAYVVLYNIDSDGFVNLLYPRDGVLERSKGNTVHFLPENGSGQIWSADDATGVEYIHAIAVKDRELIREEELEYLAGDRRRSEGDRLRIDGDPYLAFNMIDENIVVGARDNPPATDHAYFFINREVGYPRYLCTKCHAPDKLSDPYNMDCPEIVVERFAYDSEPQYPYPPLFDITYVSGETDDYYVSSKYADKYYRHISLDLLFGLFVPLQVLLLPPLPGLLLRSVLVGFLLVLGFRIQRILRRILLPLLAVQQLVQPLLLFLLVSFVLLLPVLRLVLLGLLLPGGVHVSVLQADPFRPFHREEDQPQLHDDADGHHA
jgi:hypothetical protein